jgi:hypothetical protein
MDISWTWIWIGITIILGVPLVIAIFKLESIEIQVEMPLIKWRFYGEKSKGKRSKRNNKSISKGGGELYSGEREKN